VSAQLPGEVGARLLEAARAAFAHALHVSVGICAVVSALAAIGAVVMLRRVRASGEERPARPRRDEHPTFRASA
jgi:DHA2 family multidrug resistance protein-like MFS transporter